MKEVKFIEGLFFHKKVDNAPEFIIGQISINKSKFVKYIENIESEWINGEIKISKNGTPYIILKEKTETLKKEDGDNK